LRGIITDYLISGLGLAVRAPELFEAETIEGLLTSIGKGRKPIAVRIVPKTRWHKGFYSPLLSDSDCWLPEEQWEEAIMTCGMVCIKFGATYSHDDACLLTILK
jgi:hypothetical protein